MRSEFYQRSTVIPKVPRKSNDTDTFTVVTFSSPLIFTRNMKYLSRGFHSFEGFSFRGEVFQLPARFHVTKDNDCALFFFSATRGVSSVIVERIEKVRPRAERRRKRKKGQR